MKSPRDMTGPRKGAARHVKHGTAHECDFIAQLPRIALAGYYESLAKRTDWGGMDAAVVRAYAARRLAEVA